MNPVCSAERVCVQKRCYAVFARFSLQPLNSVVARVSHNIRIPCCSRSDTVDPLHRHLQEPSGGTIWRNHLQEPSAFPHPLDRHSSSSPPSETFAGTICRPSSTGIAFNVQPALRPSQLVHNHKRPNAILHSYNVLNVIVGMHRLDDKDHPDVYLTTLPPSLPVIWVQ